MNDRLGIAREFALRRLHCHRTWSVDIEADAMATENGSSRALVAAIGWCGGRGASCRVRGAERGQRAEDLCVLALER